MPRALVVGFAVTGDAVTRALARRGWEVVVVEDRPGPSFADDVAAAGAEPAAGPLDAVVAAVDLVVPSPGVPSHHPVFALAADTGVDVVSELELAAWWDDRPIVAITGTNGKTTVTVLTEAALNASGVVALAAGNTDVPLVAAIDRPDVEVFVVEGSSFRLDRTRTFRPRVGTWLNVAPDHLDAHGSYEAYVAAKARIWAAQGPDDVAVANADDEVVMAHARRARSRVTTFGLGEGADHRLDGDALVLAGGEVLARTPELFRSLPHDVANALAAAATALPAGATVEGARSAVVAFRGLPHRVALVGEAGGVRWYDDSKSTTPHAALAAVRGFGSVVLVAGGRNKGVDLGPLVEAADRVTAVVAIGEAAGEVAGAFAGVRPVTVAASMDEAVAAAARLARPGDAVLLSPACASFDWYRSYAERGDDFARAVREVVG
jgi:UDP-N-acetylmuramoylalanine--D-glutamate ligase